MTDKIVQFGDKPIGDFRERPGAYAVIYNENDEMLALNVQGSFHLPGGGVDDGEDPEVTINREAIEEAGCNVDDLKYLGHANQFFQKEGRESINKAGIFYSARMVDIDESVSIEDDHVVTWVTPRKFLSSNASEFQKWAVKKFLEHKKFIYKE